MGSEEQLLLAVLPLVSLLFAFLVASANHLADRRVGEIVGSWGVDDWCKSLRYTPNLRRNFVS